MINIILSIIGIIITILLIVGIHEFGHFIVARALSIKVLKFSIGFGKTLWTRRDKKGTEYVIAAVPLGGYVKMLDENEEPVAKKELHLAFNNQSILKRTLVVLAGPLFNFIFAFLIYWAIFVIGFETPAPIIGKVAAKSIAANAGLKPQDEVLKINNVEVKSWSNIVMQFAFKIGDDNGMQFTTKNLKSSSIQQHDLDLENWHLNELQPNILESIGIEPYQPQIKPIIKYILDDSPAANANLQENDLIVAINNNPIKNWQEAQKLIKDNPNKTLVFNIKRNAAPLDIKVLIGENGNWFSGSEGFVGISPSFEWPKDLIRHIQYSPLQAISHASQNTLDFIKLNFLMLGKMLTGKVSVLSIGGPITIFQSAGDAFITGLLPFISFIAFLSIAIGVINLLPIPGLDGGHLLFYLIEFAIKKPLSIRVQNLMFHFGLILLMLLIVQAVANDLMRLAN